MYIFFICLIPCHSLFGKKNRRIYRNRNTTCVERISFCSPTHAYTHTREHAFTSFFFDEFSICAVIYCLSYNNMGLNVFKSYLIGLTVLLFIHNLVTVLAFTTPEKQDFLNEPVHYHSEEQLLDLFAHLAKNYPNLAKVHSLGASVEGRDLSVIQISNNVGHRDLLKPMFKYVANMHGYVITILGLTNNPNFYE